MNVEIVRKTQGIPQKYPRIVELGNPPNTIVTLLLYKKGHGIVITGDGVGEHRTKGFYSCEWQEEFLLSPSAITVILADNEDDGNNKIILEQPAEGFLYIQTIEDEKPRRCTKKDVLWIIESDLLE